jgi:hypothetical protein
MGARTKSMTCGRVEVESNQQMLRQNAERLSQIRIHFGQSITVCDTAGCALARPVTNR